MLRKGNTGPRMYENGCISNTQRGNSGRMLRVLCCASRWWLSGLGLCAVDVQGWRQVFADKREPATAFTLACHMRNYGCYTITIAIADSTSTDAAGTSTITDPALTRTAVQWTARARPFLPHDPGGLTLLLRQEKNGTVATTCSSYCKPLQVQAGGDRKIRRPLLGPLLHTPHARQVCPLVRCCTLPARDCTSPQSSKPTHLNDHLYQLPDALPDVFVRGAISGAPPVARCEDGRSRAHPKRCRYS